MARDIVFVFVVTLLYFTAAVPESGVKEMSFNEDIKFHGFHKSLFSGAKIYISGTTTQAPLIVKWTLYFSECAQAFAGLQDSKLGVLPDDFHGVVGKGRKLITNNGPFYLTENVPVKTSVSTSPKSKASTTATPKSTQKKEKTTTKLRPTRKQVAAKAPGKEIHKNRATSGSSHGRKNSKKPQRNPKNPKKPQRTPKNPKERVRRAAQNPTSLQVDAISATTPTQSLGKQSKKQSSTTTAKFTMKSHSESGRVRAVTKDGNYLLKVQVRLQGADAKSHYQVKITVKMKSDKYGFLSAAEWPLLPFYGVMSLVYLAYGVVWLIVSACQWRELLRIQFWIGGVIALGMLEKAVLFSEYNVVNGTGVPAHGLVVFGLVISCIKRTLSRILIIIVSLGFGIVKPRLGAALHRVLAVGLLYFILCVIEGGYREKALKADAENKQLVAAIPLSILDAVICWWIFMSLMQTMRTLRIRKNIIKLSLYRHFTNILVFSVIASVAFMVWSIKSYHLNACIKDWKELWIDDAFWHFLFAIVLLAIMVLWRPTANNQRYAFTPLIDVGEDDDDDMTLSDAFNGMKMRNKSEGDVANRGDKNKTKLEDDLRWVEENIPTAGGIDTALPTLLDSDEEVMTTKLEMSKME